MTTELLASVSPDTLMHLETILDCVGHDPAAAAAGWRSQDPFVVALLFASLDYPQFPCDRDKHPLTRHGFKDATTNFYTLSHWARSKPVGGWCIPTGRYAEGRPAGLWIFDIDDAAGYARLAELEAELGPLPKTWTVMSGRDGGGEHRYFTPHSEGPDMKTVPQAIIAGKRGKIDQKGRGGYAVGASSYHKSGRSYFWAEGCAPDETPLASLPATWIAAMDKADEVATARPSTRHVARPRLRREHDSSRLIGDGAGYGGFNSPIYKFAIRYFMTAGAGASAEPIITVIRRIVIAAPKDPGRDVSRYLTGSDLPRIVDRARAFVKEMKEERSVGYR